jgi:maleylpyruvate isomerase
MIVLHGYWRSTASFRVRIALNLKSIAYEQATHDLRIGEQRNEDYLGLAPQGLVPALEVDGVSLIQSLAIIEWIDEVWPNPALLPLDPLDRSIVRSMAQIIASDIHPLNNLRVLTMLRQKLDADEAQISAWIARWIQEGFAALEVLVGRHGGQFCFGDTPSLVDCCLVPQIYAARRFTVELGAFPRLVAIAGRAEKLEAFRLASPELQPDADRPIEG